LVGRKERKGREGRKVKERGESKKGKKEGALKGRDVERNAGRKEDS
jgi:hypothetical protein